MRAKYSRRDEKIIIFSILLIFEKNVKMEETIQRPVHLGSNGPLNFLSVDSPVAKIILVDIVDELTDVHT